LMGPAGMAEKKKETCSPGVPDRVVEDGVDEREAEVAVREAEEVKEAEEDIIEQRREEV
jgi:hypothetical protein